MSKLTIIDPKLFFSNSAPPLGTFQQWKCGGGINPLVRFKCLLSPHSLSCLGIISNNVGQFRHLPKCPQLPQIFKFSPEMQIYAKKCKKCLNWPLKFNRKITKMNPKIVPKIFQIDLQMHLFTNSNFQKCRKIENSLKKSSKWPWKVQTDPHNGNWDFVLKNV